MKFGEEGFVLEVRCLVPVIVTSMPDPQLCLSLSLSKLERHATTPVMYVQFNCTGVDVLLFIRRPASSVYMLICMLEMIYLEGGGGYMMIKPLKDDAS